MSLSLERFNFSFQHKSHIRPAAYTMKINIIIVGGVVIQLLSSIILLASAAAYSADPKTSMFVPFKRWWIVFYNFSWAVGFFYINWSDQRKKYFNWTMINTVYQFILNTDEISGLPSTNLAALYDSGLYIAVIAQVFIICHLYLPGNSLLKSKILIKLEKIEFNIPSTADFKDPGAVEMENKSVEKIYEDDEDDWKPPSNPFHEKSEKRNSDKVPTAIKEEPELEVHETVLKQEPDRNSERKSIKEAGSNLGTRKRAPSPSIVGDILDVENSVSQEDKDVVIDVIKSRGDVGISQSEIYELTAISALVRILQVLEFEDAVIVSKKVETDTIYTCK
eukprot:NODE_136_length_18060_cov_0.656645.p5 type:complete len:335 gc:universal NODE_136_length_18060_cov_0.656645:12674-11670(-)